MRNFNQFFDCCVYWHHLFFLHVHCFSNPFYNISDVSFYVQLNLWDNLFLFPFDLFDDSVGGLNWNNDLFANFNGFWFMNNNWNIERNSGLLGNNERIFRINELFLLDNLWLHHLDHNLFFNFHWVNDRFLYWAFHDFFLCFKNVSRNLHSSFNEVVHSVHCLSNFYFFLNFYLYVFNHLNLFLEDGDFNLQLHRLNSKAFLNNGNFSVEGFHNRLINVLNFFKWHNDLLSCFNNFDILNSFSYNTNDFNRPRNFLYFWNDLFSV